MAALEAFCARWRISELGLFGSALRADFGPASDIDLRCSMRRRRAPRLLRGPQCTK
jgi:predicted nucleotidyltransferase